MQFCKILIGLIWIRLKVDRTRNPVCAQGRSLLHVAASRGLTRLIAWLLNYKEAALNGKDTESGYSALHRAVFYGQIRTVVFLIQQGEKLVNAQYIGTSLLNQGQNMRYLSIGTIKVW